MPFSHSRDRDLTDKIAAPCVESFVAVAQMDPFALGSEEQVVLLRELERHMSWVESLRVDALAALAGPGPEYETAAGQAAGAGAGDTASRRNGLAVNDGVRDEVAAVLRLSGQAAEFRISMARDLHYKLTRTRRLLGLGVASMGQVNAIVRECERLSVDQARQVEGCALSRVGVQTPAQTRASVRRAVTRLFPITPDEDLDAEFARREVTMIADGPVMARVSAVLPAPDAIAVWNALTACASQAPGPNPGPTRSSGTSSSGSSQGSGSGASSGSGSGSGSSSGESSPDPAVADRRTMAHKRADALVAWAHRAGQDPGMPTMQGKKRLETQIVIDAATLLGLADNPGELVGFGPIPATLARRLAADSGSWRRLVTDPVTSHLLDYGTTVYTPPAALREYILARDRTCQFPGCARAAYLCDLDHVQPFTGDEGGGTTSADNLLTVCRRHHRLKTHNHWTLTIHPPGTITGTEPGSSLEPEPDPLLEPAPDTQSETAPKHERAPDLRPSNDDPTSDPPNTEAIIEWISPRGTTHRTRRPAVLGDGGSASGRADVGAGRSPELTELEDLLDSVLAA